MNTLIFSIALFSLILVPAGLFTVFWFYIIKRGWGSRWLLATIVAVFMSLIFLGLSLGAQENSILFLGLGVSVLGGIVFYIYLRTSPISNTLIGKNQNMQSNWASLSAEERNSRNQSAKLAIRDVFLIGFLQNLPLMIGIAIILLSRDTQSGITTSLALFVMGFTGILRIVLRPKHVSIELQSSKSRLIGNILVTVFAWSLALYGLFDR